MIFVFIQLERRFLRSLAGSISKKYRDVLEYQQVQHRKLRAGNLSAGIGQRDVTGMPRRAHHMDDENSSDEEAAGGREADAAEQRLHNRHLDDAAEYEGEEEDRGHVENDDDKQDEIQEENEDSEREQGEDDEDAEMQREADIQERKRSADERIK
ncbi:hypothetical protein COOONC_11961, partial [Cooperia oncophora]